MRSPCIIGQLCGGTSSDDFQYDKARSLRVLILTTPRGSFIPKHESPIYARGEAKLTPRDSCGKTTPGVTRTF